MPGDNIKGFTLIELMTAVAIIGILAAIAIPAYNDYAGRAQESEAVVLLGGLKTPVKEYYMTQGVLPTLSSLGRAGLSGKYVSSIKFSSASGIATYTATFKTAGVAEQLKGATRHLDFDSSDQTFSWRE